MDRRISQWMMFFCLAYASPITAEWTTPVDVSLPGQDATTPRVAVDSFGNATSVWTVATYDIKSSTRSYGGMWQLVPSDITSLGSDDKQIAVDAFGNAVVGWVNSLGGSQLLASTRPAGGNWQPAEYPVGGSELPCGQLQIAMDSNGDAILVWEINGFIDSATRPYNGSWQNLGSVSSHGSSNYPQIAVDSNGNATAVWEWNNGTNTIIQSATRPYNGSWQSPDNVSPLGQNSNNPQIAIDGLGNATVVWQWNNGTNSIIQSVTRPYNGSWQTVPDNISQMGQSAINPRIAADVHGNVTVVWERFDGMTQVIQSSSKPYGGTWQLIPDNLSRGQDARVPQIVIDGQGDATVIWQGSDGTNTIIQASTRPAGGSWLGTPVNLSLPGQDAQSPQLAIDVGGNVTVVWTRFNGSNWIVQSCARYLVPFPPSRFWGSGKLEGDDLLLKTKWKKSQSNDVVRYEICARGKPIKTIPAGERAEAIIHLHARHLHYGFSKDYRRFLHDKYGIRAINSSGVISDITMLDVE